MPLAAWQARNSSVNDQQAQYRLADFLVGNDVVARCFIPVAVVVNDRFAMGCGGNHAVKWYCLHDFMGALCLRQGVRNDLEQ